MSSFQEIEEGKEVWFCDFEEIQNLETLEE